MNTTRRNNASRSYSTVPRTCHSCGRRDHKVVVKTADGHFYGYCAPCWQQQGDHSTFSKAARDGDVVVVDRRKRAPSHRPVVANGTPVAA